ncbi:ras and EF-hand domain-containing protein homolog [Plakobranchus ocellatus]|uniref:Ras and EF-hand domain-containing protein homolog n=1 Tax=Plakobranchus ocellatus TaxID=259542 RepID=A0AAV3ZP80_9GAST|nr:ras and EF-hand domain-containing protein homolog [Plakobranchus ocellatus]
MSVPASSTAPPPSRYSRSGRRAVKIARDDAVTESEEASGDVTEAPRTHTEQELGQLFQACDLDGSGYIDQDELAYICQDLTGDALTDVFQQLDKDGDGRISVEEFAKGYRDIVMRKETKKRELIRQRLKSRSEENLADGEDAIPDMEYASGLNEGLKGLSW